MSLLTLTHLTPRLRRSLALASFLLGSIPSPFSAAQSSKDAQKDWYQVEIIIFSRAGAANERLPKNIVLAYPTNVRYLQNPAQQVPLKPAQSELESRLQQATLRSQSRAFTQLPEAERQLNREASIIEKQRGFKVLYHQAWRQPVARAKQAVSVILEGGSQFGDHFELEGALTISLSRYLHAKTNFWITQFEPNYGQENYHWPELPYKPVNLYSGTQADTTQLAFNNTSKLDSSRLFSLNQGDATKYTLRTSSIAGDNVGAYTKKPYLIKRIHTMRQSRRMRSGELHYLDHPLSGMIIKILPYTPKDAAAAGNR